MARNAMVARVAVMAAAAVVVVAISAGSAEARRARVAAAESVGSLSLWGRLVDLGGRFAPSKEYGKAGWNQFRVRRAATEDARAPLRDYRVARR